MDSAQAFIAFLNCEASLADDRALNLRATAAAIEANATEGKRKKRKRESLKPKRAPTSYTLYVHENYERIKQLHGCELPSTEVLKIIATQWQSIDDTEKQAWQFKAQQLKRAAANNNNDDGEVIDEIEVLPELPNGDEDWGDRKKPARKTAAMKDEVAFV